MMSIPDSLHLPDFLNTGFDVFYEPLDLDILAALSAAHGGEETVIDRIAALGGDAAPSGSWETGRRRIERAIRRGVLERGPDGRLRCADFHVRYEHWSLFEDGGGLDKDLRQRLNQWELDDYIRRQSDAVALLRAGKTPGPATVWPRYLLLAEAERLLDHADQVYLWPCNCRAMMGRCSRSIYTCLRFQNTRDIGWEISREKALSILRKADRQGLMHSGEVGIAADGALHGAICNCCPDCCFPHLLAEATGAQRLWPLSRYIAAFHPDRCVSCRLCARRCPFGAFQTRKCAGGGEPRFETVFRSDRCRGCGLCATACPKGAIDMIPLAGGAIDDPVLREMMSGAPITPCSLNPNPGS